VAFTPIVAFLLGVTGIAVAWMTLILSVVLFVVIPLTAGVLTRVNVIKNKGIDYFNQSFIPKFSNITAKGETNEQDTDGYCYDDASLSLWRH
jgi:ACR3 family arsenite transporter